MLPVQAIAEPISTESLRQLIEASVDQNKLTTSVGRSALVIAVQGYCREIGKVYPRNSPADNLWLDTEIKAGADREARVLSSLEFGRRSAQWFVDGCAIWSDHYQKTPEKERSLAGLGLIFLRFESGGAIEMASRNGVTGDKLSKYTVRMAAEALVFAATTENNPVQ